MKYIAKLYVLSTAALAIYSIMQYKTIKDLKDTLDRRDNLSSIQNEVIKGFNRGIGVVRSWREDGKITADMESEFGNVIDVDDVTKEKINKL